MLMTSFNVYINTIKNVMTSQFHDIHHLGYAYANVDTQSIDTCSIYGVGNYKYAKDK